LFERAKKRLAQILMHLLTVQIEGTAEAELGKSTLYSYKVCLVVLGNGVYVKKWV
jgi:hypothetical protein